METYLQTTNHSPSYSQVTLSVAADLEDYLARARGFLETNKTDAVLTQFPSRSQAIEFLRSVTKVYCDLDGTLMDPGSTTLTPRTQTAILRLACLGVQINGVTEKPIIELQRLLANLPPDFPLGIVFEKGAFVLERETDGRPVHRFLLATPEAITATNRAKDEFFSFWKSKLETRYPVRLELAGTGTQACIFSIDVLDPKRALPDGVFKTRFGGRKEMKIHDEKLIDQIKEEISQRIRFIAGFEDSQAVQPGKGNLEWAPCNIACRIEKDLGVMKHAGYDVQEDRATGGLMIQANQERIAVVGDSENDRLMFLMRQCSPNIRTFLVNHSETPADLVPHADFVVAGLSNGAAHLELIALAKEGCL